MYWRSMKYFTRPTLMSAMADARAAGLPVWHASPLRRELSRRDRFVVVIAYPFMSGNGTGIPHVRCVLQWAEGGLQWTVDVLLDRYRNLPKMAVNDPNLYRFQ